jgi:hypothetical protein
MRSILSVCLLLALAGCASVSPQNIRTDRMDYGQVVAESWKRQTLLNVVRLRYADAPVFLDVSSIINSYSVAGKATGSVSLPSSINPDVTTLGGEGSWSNTPTVTYQPLMGDRFTKSLLQPVPPASVFQLMQGGWPVELVMRTVVTSINGLRNSLAGVGGDAGFEQLVGAMNRTQLSGGLSYRVEARKEGSTVIVVMRRGGSGVELGEDARLIQRLLGLEGDSGEFEVAYGLVPKTNREVAMLSRSMLEILLQLGFGIELPDGHAKEGRALPGRWQAGDVAASPLVLIHSGLQAPADAYAAIPYKGYWYWIDDTDIASKRVFTFLLILFSLAETGQSYSAPVVTVPSR